MAQRFEIFWHLFVAAAKTFYRDRTAVFFSFFLPLVIMLIFGVLNFGAGAELNVGVVDEADTASSAAVIGAFDQVPILEVISGDLDAQLAELNAAFGHLSVDGVIQRSAPLPVEVREQDALGLPRLSCQFAKHGYGELRQMIDQINTW